MRCDECRRMMREFVDGKTGGERRRAVGLHLAECEECAAAIEDDRFWNDALRRHLDHELPPDLRAEILGDLADVEVGERGADLSLGWKQQLKIVWWSLARDLKRPWDLVPVVAGAVAVLLIVNWWTGDRTAPPEPFSQIAPVVQASPAAAIAPEDEPPTGRLSLSGRLI